jgi:hypothetical protein
MDNTQRYNLHKELLDKIHVTYKQKNEAYGNSFDKSVERWGYTAALVRMEDKLNRLEQLLLNNVDANDESALDTALDLASYAIMLHMAIQQQGKKDDGGPQPTSLNCRCISKTLDYLEPN